ncbi:cytochrome o ubiquinol oxidase subunit II [Affinibrenneria salicis]|uniref:Ubiquinol oxidase subunit 2 n=1 Tax=Affinibrenneria salicis TaxID=2590031 RepID=A0A5J5G120_9GAMM|nr:cytochrome o ubiquinol oxidase subunit II [Affinibrenneria salicis]KAA9000073.1 cytochrome o ubiquinol oxidase subunit II [Affinibrenneria salicis]
MRLRKYNKSFGMLSLFAATLMLSGCDMALMNPKGQIGLEQRTLILTAIGLMLIVVIPVIIMTIAFAWKFRASNEKAKYTPNWAHSNKIEAVVWTVPIIIVAILATITWKTTHALDPYKPLASDVKPITVEVVSLDWKWLFVYPELGIASVNELAFPANVPVEFKITANSVMNSFFIPRLGGQIYAMAGMQTRLHLIANEPGKYDGISGAYSGHGFSGMKFTAIATPTQEAFDQWVAAVRQSSHTLNTMDEFETLAQPSEYHPVEYFSSVQPELFKNILGKFVGHDMDMHQQGHAEHSGAEQPAHDGMNMGEHASHSGSEG